MCCTSLSFASLDPHLSICITLAGYQGEGAHHEAVDWHLLIWYTMFITPFFSSSAWTEDVHHLCTVNMLCSHSTRCKPSCNNDSAPTSSLSFCSHSVTLRVFTAALHMKFKYLPWFQQRNFLLYRFTHLALYSWLWNTKNKKSSLHLPFCVCKHKSGQPLLFQMLPFQTKYVCSLYLVSVLRQPQQSVSATCHKHPSAHILNGTQPLHSHSMWASGITDISVPGLTKYIHIMECTYLKGSGTWSNIIPK